MIMDRDLKKKIKEAQKQIINEERMKKRFISSKLDYNFIQKMINEVDADENLVVDITTSEGNRIVIAKKRKDNNSPSVFNDIIAPEDIR